MHVRFFWVVNISIYFGCLHLCLYLPKIEYIDLISVYVIDVVPISFLIKSIMDGIQVCPLVITFVFQGKN